MTSGHLIVTRNSTPMLCVTEYNTPVLGRIVKFDRIPNTEYIRILKIHRILNTEYIRFLKNERIRIPNSAIQT